MGVIGLLLGLVGNIFEDVFVESVVMLVLGIFGFTCCLSQDRNTKVCIYKYAASLALFMCGGYMLVVMLLMILSRLCDFALLHNLKARLTIVKLLLVHLYYCFCILALLGAAVSSNSWYTAILAHEQIANLIRFTSGFNYSS